MEYYHSSEYTNIQMAQIFAMVWFNISTVSPQSDSVSILLSNMDDQTLRDSFFDTLKFLYLENRSLTLPKDWKCPHPHWEIETYTDDTNTWRDVYLSCLES